MKNSEILPHNLTHILAIEGCLSKSKILALKDAFSVLELKPKMTFHDGLELKSSSILIVP
jgi:hypothetical protein